MLQPNPAQTGNAPTRLSPLLLSHQLITLAEQADGAGYQTAARHLVALAHKVLDEKPH